MCERSVSAQRQYAWRSFFFAVSAFEGEPRACGEILDVRRMRRDQLHGELTAPYHRSFLDWLSRGGLHLHCRWTAEQA